MLDLVRDLRDIEMTEQVLLCQDCLAVYKKPSPFLHDLFCGCGGVVCGCLMCRKQAFEILYDHTIMHDKQCLDEHCLGECVEKMPLLLI